MKRRTAVLTVTAAFCLGAAGYAAAAMGGPKSLDLAPGKPSVTPPAWSHSHAGNPPGLSKK
jgi:hypothetical protein